MGLCGFHLKCRKQKLGASKSKKLCADKLEQAEIGNARNLSRKEHKGRVWHGQEKVGQKRCFRDACDPGAVEGSEVHVKLEEVQEEVTQEVEDVMQQHITSMVCKGRVDGGIWGGAEGEAQENACKVKKKHPDTSDDDDCQGRGKGAGAAGPKA